MLLLLHGSDIVASRNYFHTQKEKFPNHELLEGETITLTDLAQLLHSNGLFNESHTIFIDQLIAKKKKSNDLKPILQFLDENAQENTIILWESKEVENASLKLLKHAQNKIFKLPQTLFLFLDSIKPDQGSRLVQLFHQTIETTEVEMVFFMLIRQFRILLALSDQKKAESNDAIEELKRMAPWQMSKFQQQAKLFSQEHLLSLYNELYTIEVGQKTGGLASNLISTIDFWLMEV